MVLPFALVTRGARSFCTFNVPAPIARDATDASCALPFGQYYWADSFRAHLTRRPRANA